VIRPCGLLQFSKKEAGKIFLESGATFSKLLRKILGKDSYLIDDLGKTAILKTS